jgi:hypothetical protein
MMMPFNCSFRNKNDINPACLDCDGMKPRDLVPRESRLYNLLECLEELPDPEHALYTGDRRTEFECPLCLEPSGDAIAFFPCGHRVCPSCWAGMRDTHGIDECPICRAQILHGVLQKLFPNERKLFSRFCVEFPRARLL